MKPTEPVTVVVIGPTQNGKSTFINMARSLAIGDSSPPVRVGIGDGLSVTTECQVKEYLIPRTTFKLRDSSSGKNIPIPDDEDDLFGTLWRKKNYEVIPIDGEAPPARLRIIDTPGLDDSKGRDAEHIEKVLRMIVKEPYITAIAFICNVNNSFSAGFQDIYDYYSDCMPNLMAPGALAVINTHFSVKIWQQKHQRFTDDGKVVSKASTASRVAGKIASHAQGLNPLARPKSAKELVTEDRMNAFQKAFNKNPAHFFIDCKPKENNAFEEMVSRNAFSEILDFLASKGSMPTGQMTLKKNPDMQRVDNELAQIILKSKNDWQKSQTALQQLATNNGETMVKARTALSRQIATAKNELDEWEKQLARLDNETEYPITPDITTHDDTSVANRVAKGITLRRYKGKRIITEHNAPKFFVEAKSNSEHSRWLSPSKEAAVKEWSCEYEADRFYTPQLTARTYTWNKYWYRAQISNLEERLMRKRVDIQVLEAEFTEIKHIDPTTESEESKSIRRLTNLISEAERWYKSLLQVSVPLDTGFDEKALARYEKKPNQIGWRDFADLIESSDPDLASQFILEQSH